ncbi:unnamed protein product [Sphagnum jensenii]|uniref:Uncharacterized protein n=1 Tax=Sphagnum jensenii TaxID=128206 RepID=A0ABP1C353_9BRYO
MKNHVASPAASAAAELKSMNTTVASVQFKQNLGFNNVENFDSLQEAFAVQRHAMPQPKIVAVQQLPLEESNKLPASLPCGPLTVVMCALPKISNYSGHVASNDMRRERISECLQVLQLPIPNGDKALGVPLNTLQELLELAGPELAVLQEEVEQERDKKRDGMHQTGPME